MGTADFGASCLEALAGAREHQLVGVVTQPDRPAGRRQALTAPPIKTLALKHGLSVFQPERIRRPEAVEQLRALAPELIVVVAYGQILPKDVLSLPRLGCVNVHASLLPRWRGASPIQAALLAGDGALPDRALFWHYPHYGNQGGQPASWMLRDGWKLIHRYERSADELFHLPSDISEAHDRAQECPERVAALRAELEVWQREVEAKLPKPNPEWERLRALVPGVPNNARE